MWGRFESSPKILELLETTRSTSPAWPAVGKRREWLDGLGDCWKAHSEREERLSPDLSVTYPRHSGAVAAVRASISNEIHPSDPWKSPKGDHHSKQLYDSRAEKPS